MGGKQWPCTLLDRGQTLFLAGSHQPRCCQWWWQQSRSHTWKEKHKQMNGVTSVIITALIVEEKFGSVLVRLFCCLIVCYIYSITTMFCFVQNLSILTTMVLTLQCCVSHKHQGTNPLINHTHSFILEYYITSMEMGWTEREHSILLRLYIKFSCTHLPVQVPSTSVKSFCLTVFKRLGPKYLGCSRISCSSEIWKKKKKVWNQTDILVYKFLFTVYCESNNKHGKLLILLCRS